jgi:mRNA interferase MazF
MTGYERGDVILVPYPFGERAGGRKRPALVISSREYNRATGELVIAQITGRVSAPERPGDYELEKWREANLPGPAMVRSRLATLSTSLVLRRLGTLSADDFQRALASLSAVITG